MVTKKVPKHVPAKKPAKSAVTQKHQASKKTTPEKLKTTAKTTDLPTAAVVRIIKASGAERVGSDGADLILKMTEEYIGKLTREANKLAAHGGRKTIKEEDVEMASQNI
jgi:DNA-binding protein